ncbi:MAG: hypothetical protein K2X03_23720 [Bryobacteraceae bacterium]|nr:hypothetical protein [Bryobacteraceae bacterium]
MIYKYLAVLVVGFSITPAAYSQCVPGLTGRWSFLNKTPGIAGQLVVAPGSARAQLISTRIEDTWVVSSDWSSAIIAYNANCTSGLLYLYFPGKPLQWTFEVVTDATFGRRIDFRDAAIPPLPPWGPPPPPPSPIVLQGPVIASAWPAPATPPAGTCPASPLNLLSGTYPNSEFVTTGANDNPTRARVVVQPPELLSFWFQRGRVLISAPLPPPPTVPPTPPVVLSPAPFIQLSSAGDPGIYLTNFDCQMVTLTAYFANLRPVFYDAYPRVATNGALSFVLAGGNGGRPPFVGTTGIIQ